MHKHTSGTASICPHEYTAGAVSFEYMHTCTHDARILFSIHARMRHDANMLLFPFLAFACICTFDFSFIEVWLFSSVSFHKFCALESASGTASLCPHEQARRAQSRKRACQQHCDSRVDRLCAIFHTCAHEYAWIACVQFSYMRRNCSTVFHACIDLCAIFIHAHMNSQHTHFGLHTHMKNSSLLVFHTSPHMNASCFHTCTYEYATCTSCCSQTHKFAEPLPACSTRLSYYKAQVNLPPSLACFTRK